MFDCYLFSGAKVQSQNGTGVVAHSCFSRSDGEGIRIPGFTHYAKSVQKIAAQNCRVIQGQILMLKSKDH